MKLSEVLTAPKEDAFRWETKYLFACKNLFRGTKSRRFRRTI